jgi:argininosuccinate synthase
VATLAPELKVIAPVRGWQMGRDEEIAYAREHGIPIKGGAEQRRTRSTTTSGGARRRASGSRTSRTPRRTTSSSSSPGPSSPRTSRRRWRSASTPGSRSPSTGRRSGSSTARPRRADRLQARRGIVDHIEDRIVGLKVRDIYEVPAAALILTAHSELERLVGTIHQNQFKPRLDQQWAYLVYAGLWWEPLRTDLEAYIAHVNRRVTGTIGLKLFKGSVRVVTRESPNAVYDATLASFAQSGGLFSQHASPGFIEIWSCNRAWRTACASRPEGVRGHAVHAARKARLADRELFLRHKYGSTHLPSPWWRRLVAVMIGAAGRAGRGRTRPG